MGLAKKASQMIENQVTLESGSEDLLTLQEYEFLFGMIKNSTFKGENLELLFRLTTKLQRQYLNLKNNEQ